MKERKVGTDLNINQGHLVVMASYLAFVYLLFALNLIFKHLQIQYFPILHHFPHPPNFISSKHSENHKKILKHLLQQGLQLN